MRQPSWASGEAKDLSFNIGQHQIGQDQPVFIIAEVGINHHGDVTLCKQLIEAAAIAGADAVKLQLVDADESYVANTISHHEFSNKSLDDSALFELMAFARNVGIVLFSTPGDFASLDRMCRLGMPAVKVSSGLMTNLPLIAETARRGIPMIISTGMAYEGEIASAISIAMKNNCPGLAVLKCTALYPAPDETLNLQGMLTMASRFKVPIGYSDHSLDELACLSAVALGATVIEKHFTLDKTQTGADHHISMEPKEFAQMVKQIRRLSIMRGSGLIVPAPAEIDVRAQRHRCLIARRHISSGDTFTTANVGLKRPLPGFVGLAPEKYETVLGKKAVTTIELDQPICKQDVEGLT